VVRLPVLAFLFVLLCGTARASGTTDSVWTLQRCVAWAQEHNLTVQQAVLTERLSALVARQSRLTLYPTAGLNSQFGRAFGRSINPTTNEFVDAGYNFFGLGGSADVLLFGWFGRRAAVRSDRLSATAAAADLDQTRDDISLNVATGFLRAVLAAEQIRVAEKQVDLSAAQLAQTERFVTAGRLPELNAAQLRSQLAQDSSLLITAVADYTASILDLKALLNLDFETPLVPQIPAGAASAAPGPLPASPAEVYAAATDRFGAVRAARLRVEAASAAVKAARAARLPQLSLGGTIGTNWASNFQNFAGVQPGPVVLSPYFVRGGGSDSVVPVFQQTLVPVLQPSPFFDQFGNNFRQTVTLNLTIPVFNSWQSQLALRRAVITSQQNLLGETGAEITLRQNVYRAYNDARAAVQKYTAAQRAAEAAQQAYELGQKRYDLGLTNTVEYLSLQNSQYAAESRALQARYDLIFRLKVIDYYLGKPLTL